MSSGLTRRRGGGGTTNDAESSNGVSRSHSSAGVRDGGPETSYENSENGHKIAFDPRDISESAERSKQPKLTLMDEVVLLGLKDKQVSMRSPKKQDPPTTTQYPRCCLENATLMAMMIGVSVFLERQH
jgi:hypothetical protein